MSGQVTRIDAKELKARLHDGGEIALLDAREELPFGRRHLLMASCVPLSRLELLVDDLVPRRATRVVWCDDGEGLAARAAARMAALGYQDVALLDGGIAAWEAAGFRVYSGVHVPSKAFAEVVEHEAGTPVDIRRGTEGADRPQGGHRDLRQPVVRGVSQQQHPHGRQRARGGAGLSLRRPHAVVRHHRHRQLRRPHAQHHRRAVADQCRRRQQGRVAEGRHHGLASGRASRSCMARRAGRPTSRQAGCRRRSSAPHAWQRATTSRASTSARSTPGAPKQPSAASTCSTCARPKNTRRATCAARGWRRADSSCRKPTATWRPGARASCWSTTTASARP